MASSMPNSHSAATSNRTQAASSDNPTLTAGNVENMVTIPMIAALKQGTKPNQATLPTEESTTLKNTSMKMSKTWNSNTTTTLPQFKPLNVNAETGLPTRRNEPR